MDTIRIIAIVCNAVTVVCDIVLLVLLCLWYRPNAKR